MTGRPLLRRARRLTAVLAVVLASACAPQGGRSAAPIVGSSSTTSLVPAETPASPTPNSAGPGTTPPATSTPASTSAEQDIDQLIKTEWLLTSISTAGKTIQVPAAMDATVQLDGSGNLAIDDGCNDLGGPVVVSPSRIQVAQMSSTAVGCGNYQQIRAVFPGDLTGSVRWAVEHGTLVLTSPVGSRFSFEIRSSIYPSDRPGGQQVKVLSEGTHGTANYRFYYRPSKTGVALGVEFQEAPGAGWGSSGRYRQFTDKLSSADPGDASGVMIGGTDFLFVISDEKTTRVTIAPKGAAPVDVHRYAVHDTNQFTVFGSFVGRQRHDAMITLYDKDGQVIGKPYPWRW